MNNVQKLTEALKNITDKRDIVHPREIRQILSTSGLRWNDSVKRAWLALGIVNVPQAIDRLIHTIQNDTKEGPNWYDIESSTRVGQDIDNVTAHHGRVYFDHHFDDDFNTEPLTYQDFIDRLAHATTQVQARINARDIDK